MLSMSFTSTYDAGEKAGLEGLKAGDAGEKRGDAGEAPAKLGEVRPNDGELGEYPPAPRSTQGDCAPPGTWYAGETAEEKRGELGLLEA